MKNLLPPLVLSMTIATTTISAQGVIDVHSHIITPEFVSSLENEGRLMDEGFPLPKYNVESHLKWMDEAGVETSVLTLAAPQPTSADVVRQTNEAAALVRKDHPGRFKFCAALPLPDVNAAIREAIFALDTLKADGIKLATNVRNSESHQACLNGRVVTDEDEVNPGDLSWDELKTMGEVTVYDRTCPIETVARAAEADIVLTNKVVIGKAEMVQLPHLKYIGVLATGYNVVDIVSAGVDGERCADGVLPSVDGNEPYGALCHCQS